MRKLVWSVLVLLLIVAAGLAYWHNSAGNSELEPASMPSGGITVQPDAQPMAQPKNEAASSPVSSPQKAAQAQQESKDIASMVVDKEKAALDDKTENNYDEYQYSQKKDENPGFQLRPGVTVKSGRIHIKQDDSDDKSIEIERNPKDSNNDYQVTWKKKF
ncbi:MAG: PT domain-containing protein [Pelosinus sp.]|nr:PT domain-containing protein [Pelosinus sp.]